MIHRFRTVFLSSILLTSAASAQEIFKFNSGGGGFNLHGGVQVMDLSDFFKAGPYDCSIGAQPSNRVQEATDVNRVVSASKFGKPSTTVITNGIQGYGAFNSIILGGELNTFLGSSVSGEQIDTYPNQGNRVISFGTTSRIAGGDVLFNMGLVAYRKRGFVAYPMLSVGYGATGLWLQSESNNRAYPKLAEVVTKSDNNLQNIFIWTRNAVIDFGLGGQYMMGSSTEDRAKGFSLGFRLGYKTQVGTNNILVNGNKKAKDSFTAAEQSSQPSLPNMGFSGFYAKLLIGFGRLGESR